jgi:hypothetical protein
MFALEKQRIEHQNRQSVAPDSSQNDTFLSVIASALYVTASWVEYLRLYQTGRDFGDEVAGAYLDLKER